MEIGPSSSNEWEILESIQQSNIITNAEQHVPCTVTVYSVYTYTIMYNFK